MRVIAGRLGGREIRAPRGRATRPTTDRVREALFSILGDVHGLRVLDLYAGSGALGIEALSRGAAHATFVESSRAALAVLGDNIARLALAAETRVLAQPVERARTALRSGAPYDLVFCDPPWDLLDTALAALDDLLADRLLAEDGVVVVEHPTRRAVSLTTGGVSHSTTRTWGDTSASIFASSRQPPENNEN